MEKIDKVASPWKSYEKIGFRFACIFFILFIILLDWPANPMVTYLYYYGYLAQGLDGIVSWIGKNLFHISYVMVSPYDGEHNDRTYVYLLYFFIALTGVVGTLLWSLADRKRQNYDALYYWFTAIIRYYLAFTMFLFGLYKLFRIQFPELGYYTLTETVGDMSPMHLAWTFFGYSQGYNVFMGMVESAGLLLLFRRTITFGALLSMAALTNVIAINYSFDVHAKMYPTVLFFMALFLLIKDAKRIGQFFFTGRAVSLPVIKEVVVQKKWMNIGKTAFKILVIGFFLFGHLKSSIGYRKGYQEKLNSISPYSGIYDVDVFVLNTDTLSKDHRQMWRQLVLGDRMLEAVRFKGDSVAFAAASADKKRITISGNPTELFTNIQKIYNELGFTDETYYGMDSVLLARQLVSVLNFELADSTTLHLSGAIKTDSVSIIAKKRDINLNEFRLMKRRFHWINEANYFY